MDYIRHNGSTPSSKSTKCHITPTTVVATNKHGTPTTQHKSVAPTAATAIPVTTQVGMKLAAKDNQLMNNLDICSKPKSSLAQPNKMTSLHSFTSADDSSQTQSKRRKESSVSDSVFLDCEPEGKAPPVFSSTCKELPVSKESTASSLTAVDRTKTTNESLSSSFESEALDILASLKSANALKAQLRHGKFPTDVDPVTGSPRHHSARLASDDKMRLMEGLNYSNANRNHQPSYPNSNKSSCLSSPCGSTPTAFQHSSSIPHKSPAHHQVFANSIFFKKKFLQSSVN